jgi:hypothetical protein
VSGARLITSIAIRNSTLKRKIDCPLVQKWRLGLDELVDAELRAALLGFNGEAVVYCKGISDSVAQEYAMDYARMIQNRAKGVTVQLPRIPAGLFEPNRNLIRSTLENMAEKYFQEK